MHCFGSTLNRVGRRIHVVKDLDAVFFGHASVYHYLLQLIEGLTFHRLGCVESGDKLCFHSLQLSCFLLILIDQLPLLHGLKFVFILNFS
jgi:hypothetical protein